MHSKLIAMSGTNDESTWDLHIPRHIEKIYPVSGRTVPITTARNLIKQGRHAEALRELEREYEHRTGIVHTFFYNTLAQVLRDLSRDKDALQVCTEVIRNKAGDSMTYLTIAKVLGSNGDRVGALKSCQEAIDRGVADVLILSKRSALEQELIAQATALARNERPEKVIAFCADLVGCGLAAAELFQIKAGAELKLGLRKRAIQTCNEAFSKGAFTTSLFNTKAGTQYEHELYQKCLNTCKEAGEKGKADRTTAHIQKLAKLKLTQQKALLEEDQ